MVGVHVFDDEFLARHGVVGRGSEGGSKVWCESGGIKAGEIPGEIQEKRRGCCDRQKSQRLL